MNHTRFEQARIGPAVTSGGPARKPLTAITEALCDFTRRSKSYGFEERPSDSPFVEAVWRTPIASAPPDYSQSSGPYIFPAALHWSLVVIRHEGRTEITVWGPGAKAAPARCPRESELFGIVFKQGAFMPHLPLSVVRNRKDIALPEAAGKSFWLNGHAWTFPDFENADTFADRLVRCGLLVRDPLVDHMLRDRPRDMSLRSAQRRFLQATGLTCSVVRQMERARYAKDLLQQGVSILDAMVQAGYYDQAHLTRSLKRFIGLTPTQIVRLSPLG